LRFEEEFDPAALASGEEYCLAAHYNKASSCQVGYCFSDGSVNFLSLKLVEGIKLLDFENATSNHFTTPKSVG
jgi:hypothetical protein